MVANIEDLAGFTKRNRHSCEIFYATCEKTLFGATVLAKTMAPKNLLTKINGYKCYSSFVTYGTVYFGHINPVDYIPNTCMTPI